MALWQKLEEYWRNHAESSFHSKQESEGVFNDLMQRYAEPHRSYHTGAHLADLFEKWEALELSFEKPRVVAMALWFHDAIYDPKSKKNEQESADLAGQTLYGTTQLSSCEIEEVCSLILATAKHKLNSKHPDLKLFLDLDLSILGSPAERYQAYAREIREEYKHVPEMLYKFGRKRVLKRFVKKDELFFTPLFQANYESQAAENITQEILNL